MGAWASGREGMAFKHIWWFVPLGVATGILVSWLSLPHTRPPYHLSQFQPEMLPLIQIVFFHVMITQWKDDCPVYYAITICMGGGKQRKREGKKRAKQHQK